jgi:hypothetical protein
MSWRPLAWEWHPAAEGELLHGVPHWETAATIAAAVRRFAETGAGPVERVAGDPNRYRLRVAGYHVFMWIDVATQELTVTWLYRAR